MKKIMAIVAVAGSLAACAPAANTPAPTSQQQLPPGHVPLTGAGQRPVTAATSFAGIAKADQTVAEIYARQSDLMGTVVNVRGKVVKYNSQIMGKNWVHVQDGTGSAGSNDLTATTADGARVGDIVLVSGTITRDKDFGGGYKYSLIIEDAKVTVEGK